MKELRKKESTSVILQVLIQDSSSTSGAGLTGLVFNSAGLTAYYHRSSSLAATAITLATMTVGTYTSGGFKEIDATNMPGWYQFCPPDAAFASGADSVGFHLKGATNMVPKAIEIQLDANWAAGENDGLLTAFTSTTTTLASTEPTGTDTLKDWVLVLPDSKEAFMITAWNGTTKVATHKARVNNPSVSDPYYLIPIKSMDARVESVGSYTAQQILSLALSALSGVTTQSGTTDTFKTPDGTTTRMALTADATGQRSAITLTPSS